MQSYLPAGRQESYSLKLKVIFFQFNFKLITVVLNF